MDQTLTTTDGITLNQMGATCAHILMRMMASGMTNLVQVIPTICVSMTKVCTEIIK